VRGFFMAITSHAARVRPCLRVMQCGRGMAALLRAAALLVLVGVPAAASAAADAYPAARLMSSAERQAQVARRNAICNASVVVASCWGFDPADSTEFLQAALDSGARKVIIPPMCDDSYADCPTSQSTGDHKWITSHAAARPLEHRDPAPGRRPALGQALGVHRARLDLAEPRLRLQR
jgi:hypothetical protein